MDSYAEQLVIKPQTTEDAAKKAALVTLGVVLSLIFLVLSLFVFTMFLLLLVGTIWGTWWVLGNQYVEYEYLLTNGELDIDKIIGKRKRLRLVSAEVKQFTAFAKEQDAPNAPDSAVTILAEGAGMEAYCADFENEDFGTARLIFSPNEKMLATMRPFLRGDARQV